MEAVCDILPNHPMLSGITVHVKGCDAVLMMQSGCLHPIKKWIQNANLRDIGHLSGPLFTLLFYCGWAQFVFWGFFFLWDALLESTEVNQIWVESRTGWRKWGENKVWDFACTSADGNRKGKTTSWEKMPKTWEIEERKCKRRAGSTKRRVD